MQSDRFCGSQPPTHSIVVLPENRRAFSRVFFSVLAHGIGRDSVPRTPGIFRFRLPPAGRPHPQAAQQKAILPAVCKSALQLELRPQQSFALRCSHVRPASNYRTLRERAPLPAGNCGLWNPGGRSRISSSAEILNRVILARGRCEMAYLFRQPDLPWSFRRNYRVA